MSSTMNPAQNWIKNLTAEFEDQRHNPYHLRQTLQEYTWFYGDMLLAKQMSSAEISVSVQALLKICENVLGKNPKRVAAQMRSYEKKQGKNSGLFDLLYYKPELLAGTAYE